LDKNLYLFYLFFLHPIILRSFVYESSPGSPGKKLSKLLSWMLWLRFEPRLPHLCVWVYNDFFISFIYPKNIEVIFCFISITNRKYILKNIYFSYFF
jgi:hypothetical protein